MDEFWYLLSFIVSTVGFMGVGAVSFLVGDDLLTVALKAIGTFVVLWLVGSVMRALMSLGAASEASPEQNGQKE